MAADSRMATRDDWEKERAPRVTRKHVVVAVAIYGAWIAFLAALAADRWFGTLQ